MIDYYEPSSSNQLHFLYIFPGGEVKCILHIGEGECEGNIKSFFKKQKPVGKRLCVSSISTAEERRKKAGNKVRSNH